MKNKYNIRKIQDFSDILKKVDKIKEERRLTLRGYKGQDGKSEVLLSLGSKEINLRSQCADTQYIEIGGILYDVKELLRREFGSWVEKNCPFSHRTANNLMSIYKLCLEHPPLTVLPKSALYFLSSNCWDKDLRQGLADALQVINDITDSSNALTLKEVRKLQLEYLNGNISLDDDSITQFIADQKRIKLHNRWKREGNNLIKILQKKVAHYETRLGKQREVTGETFNNESTTYMLGIITILEEAVEKLSTLFDQNEVAHVNAYAVSDKPVQLCAPYIEAEFVEIRHNSTHSSLPVFKFSPDEYCNLDIVESDLLSYYLSVQVPSCHDTNYCMHADIVGRPAMLVSNRHIECRAAGHARPKVKLLPPPAAQTPNRMPELKMLPAPPASTMEITALDTDTDMVSRGDNSAEQPAAHHRHIVDGEYRGITLEELLKEEFPDPVYLIKPIFQHPSISFLYAEPGVGKSWLAHSISIALTRKNPEGITIGPWIVTQNCAALHIDGEIRLPDLMKKISLLEKQMGSGDPDKPLTIWSSIQFDEEDGEMINLAEEEWRDRITQFFVKNTQCKMLILDNLTSLTDGLNESVKQKWSPINRWLLRLRGMGVSVIIIDHANREGNLRGTNSKVDNVNNNIFIKHDTNYHVDTVAMIVQFKKGRDLKPGEGADVKLKLEGNSQEGLRLVQYS